MALITEIIPPQGYEIVQNRIASILLEELTNQKTLQGLTSEFEVFLERQEPFDKSEDVMLSVICSHADYDDYTSKDSQGGTMYYIDIYCKAQGTPISDPSMVSRSKLFTYVGMVRYILQSGKYQTLGLPYGLIGGRYVKKVLFDTDYSSFGNHSNWDGSFIRFCRIFYLVRIQENQQLWDGIPLLGNDTNITLEETSKGYKLNFNN